MVNNLLILLTAVNSLRSNSPHRMSHCNNAVPGADGIPRQSPIQMHWIRHRTVVLTQLNRCQWSHICNMTFFFLFCQRVAGRSLLAHRPDANHHYLMLFMAMYCYAMHTGQRTQLTRNRYELLILLLFTHRAQLATTPTLPLFTVVVIKQCADTSIFFSINGELAVIFTASNVCLGGWEYCVGWCFWYQLLDRIFSLIHTHNTYDNFEVFPAVHRHLQKKRIKLSEYRHDTPT